MHIGQTSRKEHQKVSGACSVGFRDLPSVLCLVFGGQGNCCSEFYRLVRSTFLRSAVKLNAVAEAGTLREL